MFRMHTAHLANVSKSVTKNATFPRTGGLPCLITWQLHLYSCWGTHFLNLSNPQLGSLFPLFHDLDPGPHTSSVFTSPQSPAPAWCVWLVMAYYCSSTPGTKTTGVIDVNRGQGSPLHQPGEGRWADTWVIIILVSIESVACLLGVSIAIYCTMFPLLYPVL